MALNKVMGWAVALGLTCAAGPALADITIYSGQHKAGTDAVAKAFTEKTGIQVNVKKGSSEQMAGQLAEEGERTPADVFWAEQTSPMLMLSQKGLLVKLPENVVQAMHGEGYDAVPKAENQDWVATSGRARVVAYNPDLIKEEELATSVLDYAKPEWKGRIGFVPTSGAFLEQIIGMTDMLDEETALNWLLGLKDNGKQYAKNSVALAAVERGEIPAALINNYYWHNMVREQGGLDKVKSRLNFIGHEDPGAMMTYATIAVLNGSDNQDEAVKFVEYAVSQEGQQAFANERAEYPLRADVQSSFDLKPYKEIGAPKTSVTTFEDKEKAARLLEKAGLK
ncbi:extracellular solute-binding protein [Orrella sp. 11846]|uniref:extracellular solute-binding protein n=1 Tax=Orrella sp. 11846 TaxID=3409913 RepID=UPI003B5A072E